MLDAIAWLVVGLVIAFVGWPLFRRADASGERGAAALSPLERQKFEAFAALKEAEFDQRMGKLSEEDFAALTQRYRAQALSAITALDAARRAELPRRGRAPVRFAFCPACGERLVPRANFCSACGESLRDRLAGDGSRETGAG